MMRSTFYLQRVVLAMALLASLCCSKSRAIAGPVATFDDIDFWVGSGVNSAAIAIDWDDTTTSPTALVWGFRWDGPATGQMMLQAVVKNDPRLFAKTNDFGGGLGSALYGLGYDDGDGEFAIDDGTAFDDSGFAGSLGPADGATALDPGDLYEEGWFLGYWHYGLSVGNPYGGGSWKASMVGMSNRVLQDGDWDSWTFTPTFNQKAFAANPQAAQSPATGDDADFNGDGVVDGNDFLAWQRGFGTLTGATLESGDANRDGAVNGADLESWREQFGRGGDEATTLGAVASIPEPASLALAGVAALSIGMLRRRR